MLLVLSLLVLAFVGTASAPNYAIEHYLWQGEMEPTVDGTYSPNGEWDPSGTQTFGTDGIFRDYWVMDPNLLCLLIETASHFRVNKTRGHGVHPDAPGSDFLCQALGETDKTGF